jgi:integrase
MARAPRGTTFVVKFHNDPQRAAKWAVHWNEYQADRVGGRKQRSEWFETEAEAEEFAQGMRDGVAGGTPATPRQPPMPRAIDTLAHFATTVWLPYVKEDRSGATHKNYSYCVTDWLAPEPSHPRYPGLGNVILSDTTFTKRVVREYLASLHKAGVSLSMRRRLHTTLSACLGYAFQVERLTLLNPCSKLGAEIPRKGERNADPQPNPFTPDEITRIFDQVNAVEALCWQVYFLWQYHVGTRPGEAAALKWTALDLDRKRARVEWAYCPVDQIDKEPKTHECRDLDLTEVLVTLLLKWRSVQREAAFRRGYPAPEYVFTTLQASRKAPRQLARILQCGAIREVFTRTMKACAITGHTLYDFRDSFATSHLAMGWDRKLAWVSKQLGHKTPATTQKHYYAYRDTVASRTFADEIGGFK